MCPKDAEGMVNTAHSDQRGLEEQSDVGLHCLPRSDYSRLRIQDTTGSGHFVWFSETFGLLNEEQMNTYWICLYVIQLRHANRME